MGSHTEAKPDLNKMAEAYHPDMPVDKMMGVLPEVLRKHPKAKRSMHPIQSFAGIRADAILNTQTIYNPLAPIGALAEQMAGCCCWAWTIESTPAFITPKNLADGFNSSAGR